MKKIFILVIFLLLNIPGYTFSEEYEVLRLSDGKNISFNDMLEDIKKANVIFIGEKHDVKNHHEIQLDIIKSLYKTKTPISIGLEMFNYESQNDLDLWSSASISLERFIQIYYKNWNFEWELYKDILIYIKDNHLQTIGLNVPPEISKKVAESGFSSLSKEEMKRLPPEVSCIVNETYMNFIRKAYLMHEHKGRNFQYFCEAQLLWDQSMAYNIAGFTKKYPDKKLVVLSGNGHAWKRGIPEQLKFFSKESKFRVILPYVEKYIEPGKITYDDADYILFRH